MDHSTTSDSHVKPVTENLLSPAFEPPPVQVEPGLTPSDLEDSIQSKGEDFETDPEVDPLTSAKPQSLAEWEISVKSIIPRDPLVKNPDQLASGVQALLIKMRDLKLRSDESSLQEAEALLASLPSLLRNPDNFVAGSFTSCFAAWSALLSKSKRRSAKNVLSWLRHGVKPKFVNTAAAKPQKRDLVIGMLCRQVPAPEIPHMLSGIEPHPVSFDNHKSFYDNWEFGSGEVNKLVLWSAALLICDGDEMPLVITPLGVATTGGKQRLILNFRVCQLVYGGLTFSL